MQQRLSRRNVLVKDIQQRLASGAPRGSLRADARKAEEKAKRASTTADRRLQEWLVAKAKQTPPLDAPPLDALDVINAAETGTAKTGITLRMAKAWIETRKGSRAAAPADHDGSRAAP